MGWEEKVNKKKREMKEMSEQYRAIAKIQVVKVVAVQTPQGPALEQTKMKVIECSGIGETEGEAVEKALNDGVEEFVNGLSRISVITGPELVK